jgi:uncharacterized protein YutE (UPF0331/DUF86 family)
MLNVSISSIMIMSGLRTELVQKKLKGIRFDLEQLHKVVNSKDGNFTADEEKMTLAERRLERIINRAIDINLHIIRSSGSPAPEDYTQSFLELAKLKVISHDLAKNLAPAAGARNMLVHEYDEIERQPFMSSVEHSLQFFPAYVKSVEEYLTLRDR